jgi:hypothetical protein
LVAVLVVTATLPAGLAVGQTEPTSYDRTFTDGQERIGVDTGNYSGNFTFQVTAGDAPGGATTIYQEDFNVAESAQLLMFRNAGAYDNITVSVIPRGGNAGEPDLIDGSEEPTIGSRHYVASTGGDADLHCDPAEKINSIVNPLSNNVDCNALPGATQVDTSGTDAEQTKVDIYQSALTQKSASDTHLTTIENDLQDAKTVARLKGKNAYVRALNNGSSKTAAKAAAKEAVSEHYATVQKNLANQWRTTLYNHDYLNETAMNESGIAIDYVTMEGYWDGGSSYDVYYSHMSNESVSLVNGRSVTVPRAMATAGDRTDTLTYGYLSITGHTNRDGGTVPTGLKVQAPNQNYNSTLVLDNERYTAAWSKIQSQNTEVQGEMDTLADNTYDAYQNGQINNSDLVDPYLLASEYSPGSEYQGWAAAQLTLLGTNSPENFDQIGRFNVSTESGTEYQGVLFSQENPPSGQFSTNTTYNPSAINGTQYVVTDESIQELNENFTIDSIETHDGEKRQNVTIVEKHYETTNSTELKQLYEDLAYERAMIEAREKALKAEGNGGGGLFGGGDVPPGVAVGFVAAIVLLALIKD